MIQLIFYTKTHNKNIIRYKLIKWIKKHIEQVQEDQQSNQEVVQQVCIDLNIVYIMILSNK